MHWSHETTFFKSSRYRRTMFKPFFVCACEQNARELYICKFYIVKVDQIKGANIGHGIWKFVLRESKHGLLGWSELGFHLKSLSKRTRVQVNKSGTSLKLIVFVVQGRAYTRMNNLVVQKKKLIKLLLNLKWVFTAFFCSLQLVIYNLFTIEYQSCITCTSSFFVNRLVRLWQSCAYLKLFVLYFGFC